MFQSLDNLRNAALPNKVKAKAGGSACVEDEDG